MPYYRIRGEVIEAPDPAGARRIADMGGIERFARGAGLGAANVGRNVVNLLPLGGLEPEWASDEAITRAAENPILKTGSGWAGSIAGEIGASMIPGGLAGKAVLGAGKIGSVLPGAVGRVAGALGKTARGRKLVPTLAAAAGGATEGAITAGPGHRVEGGLLGGGLGGAVGAAMPALGKFLANPVKATPEARRIMDMGVSLTPGQMNPRSAIGSLEEAISIFPGVKNARDYAKDQLVRRQLRNAAAPGSALSAVADKTLDAMPIETVGLQAYKSFEPGYDALRTAVPEIKGSEIGLAKALRDIAMDPGKTALKTERKAVNATLQNALTLLPQGKSPGFGELQQVRSIFREGARDSVDNPRMQRLFVAAADEITDRMKAGMPPDQLARLRALDDRYADMATLAGALRRGNASPSGFTQGQLLMELKPIEGRSFGMGGSGRELSRSARAGKQVLEEKTPITGARMLVPAAAGIGLGKAALIPGAAIALGATTNVGRKIMGGGTARQKALTKQLRVLRNSPKTMGTIGATSAAVAPLEDY